MTRVPISGIIRIHMFSFNLPFRGNRHSLTANKGTGEARVNAQVRAAEIAKEIVTAYGPSEEAIKEQCVIRSISEANPHITWASLWTLANSLNKNREQ